MLYEVGSQLPEYRVRAFKSPVESTNLIQDDLHARRYGYRGGLVPGTSVFAYMSRSLIEFMGRDWLERGSAEVRFVHPLYEGEEARISGTVSSLTRDGTVCIDYQASNAKGVICGVGLAKLPDQRLTPEPSFSEYPAGTGKLGRPISLKSLKVGQLLTPITSEFTWNIHWEYCQKTIRDHHPIYQRLLHPGWLLSQANRILAANYDIPAWIQVESIVQNYHAQEEECAVETRGHVQEKFETKGHHYVVLNLALFAGARCLETIRHTVIFRIAPRAA